MAVPDRVVSGLGGFQLRSTGRVSLVSATGHADRRGFCPLPLVCLRVFRKDQRSLYNLRLRHMQHGASLVSFFHTERRIGSLGKRWKRTRPPKNSSAWLRWSDEREVFKKALSAF